MYLVSDLLYVILFKIIGYRKDVVTKNLRNSFPEKSEAEIMAIRKKFLRYFCDLVVEVFKTLTISKKSAVRHCTLPPESLQLLDKYAQANQSIILALGHKGNWEWGGNTFSTLVKHQLYVIYSPLENKQFDKMMYDMRTRFGTKLIPRKSAFKEILAGRNELSATAFIADQTPSPDKAHWMTFLNQDTPVFKGLEAISKKLNYPVIYLGIKRLRRGYYEANAEVLSERPAELRENEVTELFTRRLEKDIISEPETWLWTHKRWKHKRPVA